MGGKSKEQYEYDILMDLFFLTEKEGNLIDQEGFARIHEYYNDTKKNILKTFISEANYTIQDENLKELKREIQLIRKCFSEAFYTLCEMKEKNDKKHIKYTKSIIENHTLRCILEPASYCYGMPHYNGKKTQYRYVSEDVYNWRIKDKKSISEFAGKIHYEHVIPMHELIQLLKNQKHDSEIFDNILKTKMFVCCVSDKENKKLKKDSMPKENKENWKKDNANYKDIWARYIEADIQVYDLYKDKPILPIK